MGYAEDNAAKSNQRLAERAVLNAQWSMTREVASWAEKVALLEERVRELTSEVTRLANELARKYE